MENKILFPMLTLGILFGLLPHQTAMTATPVPMASAPNKTEDLPLDQIPERIAQLAKSLDPGKDMTWSPVLSPPLPSAWPPGPETIWSRYAYAYGRKFPPDGLADGQYVSEPWARVDLTPEQNKARLVMLRNNLAAVDIQGARPLQPDEQALFGRSQEIFGVAMALKRLPAGSDASLDAMKKYYRFWLQTNGAIAARLKPAHLAFFKWVEG